MKRKGREKSRSKQNGRFGGDWKQGEREESGSLKGVSWPFHTSFPQFLPLTIRLSHLFHSSPRALISSLPYFHFPFPSLPQFVPHWPIPFLISVNIFFCQSSASLLEGKWKFYSLSSLFLFAYLIFLMSPSYFLQFLIFVLYRSLLFSPILFYFLFLYTFFSATSKNYLLFLL